MKSYGRRSSEISNAPGTRSIVPGTASGASFSARLSSTTSSCSTSVYRGCLGLTSCDGGALPVMVPVVVLTARDQWHERVEGLKAGADDYVGKPFHVEELLARVQALLRHGVVRGVRLACSGVELDEDHQTATVGGTRTEVLTGLEFRLLRCFMQHPGEVLSKSYLGEHVYGLDADPDSNVIEVYINRLCEIPGHR